MMIKDFVFFSDEKKNLLTEKFSVFNKFNKWTEQCSFLLGRLLSLQSNVRKFFAPEK